MFKKIKEFIEAFKNAYNTINANKINAKKAIDDYKKEVDHIVYAVDSLKIIFARLEAIYKYFPIKDRQDFITKTLDLLRYGRKDANGEFKDICGWYALYYLHADDANIKLKHMNNFYKEGKYDEVISLVKECKGKLNEFNVLYGIEEITSEANE